MRWRLKFLRKKFQTWRLTIVSDPHHCSYCGISFSDLGKRIRTVDHIQPLSKGGTWRLSNLALACSACNQAKSNRLSSEFLYSEWLKKRRVYTAALMAKEAA